MYEGQEEVFCAGPLAWPTNTSHPVPVSLSPPVVAGALGPATQAIHIFTFIKTYFESPRSVPKATMVVIFIYKHVNIL